MNGQPEVEEEKIGIEEIQENPLLDDDLDDKANKRKY